MHNIYNENRDIGFFNNGDYLVFSFKKTEKIVSAIYLVTSLIKDNEPMKWELRESSMSLLSVLMALNSIDIIDKNKLFQSFYSSAIQMISFLNISSNSGLISNMNASILIKEIDFLVNYLKKESANSLSHNSNYILSDSFFLEEIPKSDHKGHISNEKNTSANDVKQVHVKDKKDTRKNSILSLLKKDSQLTIKDFVKVIKDCSEKTIQRELIDLVEKGIIKRNGERRWSTYSLA